MTNLANWFALEPELIGHLVQALGDIQPKVAVFSAPDLASVIDASKPTPAVHVLYKAYRVVEARSDGSAARIEQTWEFITTARNVKTMRSGEASRAEAGLIVRRVAAALMGYRPESAAKPLRLADAQADAYIDGCQYVPLAFVAELVLN